MIGAVEPLPSILDLGRHIRVLTGKIERAQAVCDTKPVVELKQMILHAERIYCEHQDALTDLIASYPARTIGDAAAQLVAVWEFICQLEDFDLSKTDREKVVSKIRRLTLSVLPLVIEAAGLDVLDLAGEEIVAYRLAAFGGLEQAA